MLDTSSIYWEPFLVNTSSIPLDLSSFCSRYLLIPSRSIEIFYIYLRFDSNHFKIKYLDISLFSLDPNHHFSLTSFFPSYFQPLLSFNPPVSGLNLFFFSFLIHFMHLNLGFQAFGKIFGFLNFLWNLWVRCCWFVLTCLCIAFSSIIIMISCILSCVLN